RHDLLGEGIGRHSDEEGDGKRQVAVRDAADADIDELPAHNALLVVGREPGVRQDLIGAGLRVRSRYQTCDLREPPGEEDDTEDYRVSDRGHIPASFSRGTAESRERYRGTSGRDIRRWSHRGERCGHGRWCWHGRKQADSAAPRCVE